MATATVSVTGTAWTDLGIGPLSLFSPQDEVLQIYSNATEPGTLAEAAQIKIKPNEPLNYQYTDKLWVRLADGGAAAVSLRTIK